MKVPLHVYCKNYISHTELKHKSDQKKIERLCSYVFHGNLNSMFQLFLILTTDQILKYTRFYQNAKNNFHLGGTEIWGIISYTRLISWVYMTFSVSVGILIFLGGEIGQNDHVYPACSDFRKCIFFQFRTSFDQSNVYIRRKQSILQAYSIVKGFGSAPLLAEWIRVFRTPWDDVLREHVHVCSSNYVVYNLFMNESMCTHVHTYMCGCDSCIITQSINLIGTLRHIETFFFV